MRKLSIILLGVCCAACSNKPKDNSKSVTFYRAPEGTIRICVRNGDKGLAIVIPGSKWSEAIDNISREDGFKAVYVEGDTK